MSYKRDPLYIFIENFLPSFLPSNIYEKLLLPDAYSIFKRAFTHPDVDKNFHYERLEFIGDSAIKASFVNYIARKYPEVNEPGQLSILTNYFLEKEFFASLSDKYKFTKYIRVPSNRTPTIDEREDIFESFVGALQTAGDKFVGIYIGQMIVEIFVTMVFDDIVIETNNIDKYRNYVQVLKEKYFDPRKTMMQFEKIKKDSSSMIVKILHGKDVLGVGTGRNVEEAKFNAAKDALVKQKIIK